MDAKGKEVCDHTQDRLDEMGEALASIRQWCDAYPVDIFSPLSKSEVKRAADILKGAGISIGALHAQWARRLLAGVKGYTLLKKADNREG